MNQQRKSKVDIKEREEGERKTAKRELKRHEERGEGGHLKEGRGDSYLVKPNFSKRFS